MANIVRLDKIQASYNGNIESVRHTSDMDNGSIINLGDLIANEAELRAVSVPAAASLGTAEVLLVASPEVNYEVGKGLKDFTNEANKPARAYHLQAGDIFTVTYGAIACLANDVPVKGNYVTSANNSVKLTEANALGDNRFYGKIIELTTLGYDSTAAAVIQVVQS